MDDTTRDAIEGLCNAVTKLSDLVLHLNFAIEDLSMRVATLETHEAIMQVELNEIQATRE